MACQEVRVLWFGHIPLPLAGNQLSSWYTNGVHLQFPSWSTTPHVLEFTKGADSRGALKHSACFHWVQRFRNVRGMKSDVWLQNMCKNQSCQKKSFISLRIDVILKIFIWHRIVLEISTSNHRVSPCSMIQHTCTVVYNADRSKFLLLCSQILSIWFQNLQIYSTNPC